ncbi:hypothetical protein L208DRAFT_1389558 [Tricholoma matsutake]|nr:hypothetical protein L208DRAFT_1389558 [Tricholoma matsutake 945]
MSVLAYSSCISVIFVLAKVASDFSGIAWSLSISKGPRRASFKFQFIQIDESEMLIQLSE